MLGKLIKYEFKSTAIYFLPIYAALVLLSVFNYVARLLNQNHYNSLIDLSVIATVLLYTLFAIGLAVTTFVVIVIRFYKNLLGTEGYLMFTLPVTIEQNIFAKFFVAMVWFIGSCLLGILTIGPVINANLLEFYYENTFEIDTTSILTWIIVIVFAIAALAISLLFIYFCMCIGQLFNSHKFIASVGTYFILNGAFQVLTLVIITIIGGAYRYEALGWLDFFCESFSSYPLLFAACFDLAAIAFAMLLFVIDSQILKKKLNLT